MAKVIKALAWLIAAVLFFIAPFVYEYVWEYLNPRYPMRRP